MKCFKKKLLLLCLILTSAGLNFGFNQNENKGLIENTLDNYSKGISLKNVKKQNSAEKIDISETFVQIGQKTIDSTVHNYLRFTTAVKIDSAINSLSYIRNVKGVEEAEFAVNTVYKTLRVDEDEIYFNGTEMVKTRDEAVETDYYWACYTVELTKDDFKATDFKLNLKVNDTLINAYTACSYNTLLTNDICSVKFSYKDTIIGKQIVVKGNKVEYLGPTDFEGNYHIVDWNQDMSSIQSDVELKAICSLALEAEDSQRQVITSKDTSQGTTLRLDTGKLIEYTVFTSEEIEATMYANMWSRGQLQNDTSILDIYDVYVNETKVETSSETTILSAETFGSKWKIDAHAKVGKVHLDKGINFVKVISKKANVTMLDNLELNYSGKGYVTLPNVKEFQSVEAHIEYVSTDGVEKVGVNGLITNAAYLSPFTKGSNVRLNTIDYVEYAFESSTDIEVALSVDMSLRAIKEATSIFDLYKVFIKENAEEYTEIKSNDNRAIGQSVTSTKNYGEFHTAGITYLSFKAGANYTLKLQSRANIHLESIMFASSELIDINLVNGEI